MRWLDYSLIASMGAALLVVFIFIHVKGEYLLIEPNPFVLWLETVLFASIMVYGIYRYISERKKARKHYSKQVKGK